MSAGGHIATRSLQPAEPRRKAVFGIAVNDLPREAAIERLMAALRERRHLKLAFCNAHMANLAWRDDEYRQTLAAFTVFADGLGIDIAAWILHGGPFAANLNGTDFVPALLASAPRRLRIALYGAKPGVAERAAAALQQFAPQHAIVHVADGYGDGAAEAAFLDRLKKAPADVILVALGNPLQERWIARNLDAGHATLAIGVGALFDFLSEETKRAPFWLRRMRLEWLHRLAQEPRRLFWRYVVGNPLFLWRVLLEKSGARRQG